MTEAMLSLLVPSFLKFGSEGGLISSCFFPYSCLIGLTDPVIQLVFDASRQILYSLSERSNIGAFYLGPGGDAFRTVAYAGHLASSAQRLCPRSPLLETRSFKIISIVTVPRSESRLAHLLAITNTGARLYFTTASRQYGGPTATQPPQATAPQGLDLIHVRLPPSARSLSGEQTRTVMAPSVLNVHASFYADGVTFLANSTREDADSVLCIAPDLAELTRVSLELRRRLLTPDANRD